jgi:hypothetical protein
MDKKVLKTHAKGQKHVGKTNWAELLTQTHQPKVDAENPELVGTRQFKKANNQK